MTEMATNIIAALGKLPNQSDYERGVDPSTGYLMFENRLFPYKSFRYVGLPDIVVKEIMDSWDLPLISIMNPYESKNEVGGKEV